MSGPGGVSCKLGLSHDNLKSYLAEGPENLEVILSDNSGTDIRCTILSLFT